MPIEGIKLAAVESEKTEQEFINPKDLEIAGCIMATLEFRTALDRMTTDVTVPTIRRCMKYLAPFCDNILLEYVCQFGEQGRLAVNKIYKSEYAQAKLSQVTEKKLRTIWVGFNDDKF